MMLPTTGPFHHPQRAVLAPFSTRLLVCLLAIAVGCEQPPAPNDSTEGEASKGASSSPDESGSKEGAADSTLAEETMPQPPNSVLRHAVFFKFKDSSSEADIERVVEAFRALPGKIDAIVDFKWGTNNSPEGLDDGFTHCFLLTFEDAAGRATYLPHEAHKAFGNVLRPHMEDVFVIDYWGDKDADEVELEKPLMHAVFFQFKDSAKPEQIRAVEQAFAALPEKIDAIKHFEWGTNNSPEAHDDGFTHCFMVTFGSEADRETYLPHPDHQKFVELLKPILAKPRVLDFWGQP